MSYGNIKSISSGPSANNRLAAAATLWLAPNLNKFYLTGTDTVTSLRVSGPIVAGREVTFVSESGTTTFTNTNGPTTEGTMDLDGSNFALSTIDVLKLVLRSDGTWIASTLQAN